MRKNNRDKREARIAETRKTDIENMKFHENKNLNLNQKGNVTNMSNITNEKRDKYYVAELKGGHVKPYRYVLFNAYINAKDKRDAFDQCNRMPRAKKHSKGFVISLEEITKADFIQGRIEMSKDPYWTSVNPQQQRAAMELLEDRIFYEPDYDYSKRYMYNKTDRIGRNIERHKNARKKYMNRYIDRRNDDNDFDTGSSLIWR
ncbi:MAG TPA: hypothetical protein DEP65_07490 [Ruminococcus sp.]|nr:hypothetical protein [Ruminococcus sp.]